MFILIVNSTQWTVQKRHAEKFEMVHLYKIT